MEYRFLGNTGIKVSAISFGTMTWREKDKDELYFSIFKKCYDSGINFFDTAEGYFEGLSEEVLGRMIKRLGVPREDLVISTKLFNTSPGQKISPNKIGLSRKHIIEGTKNSLKRLQLDYVDVLFCHRFDYETPIEEVVRAMNWVIEKGWALYWGTSEWSSEQIKEAYGICDKLGLMRPVVEQPQYNMLTRNRFEVEYADLFDKFRMGSTVWSPMCGGLLSGKYIEGIPDDTRFSDPLAKKIFLDNYFGANGEKKDKINNTLKSMIELATKLETTLPILALAWVIKNNDVSTCMIGATKVEQVEENIKALQVYKKLTPEVEETIEKILGNSPDTSLNWKKWIPMPKRR